MISGRQAHRLREVLRLEVGARIVVLDGGGLEYLVELLDITSGRVTTEVVKCYHCSNEPRIQITLEPLAKFLEWDDFPLQDVCEWM